MFSRRDYEFPVWMHTHTHPCARTLTSISHSTPLTTKGNTREEGKESHLFLLLITPNYPFFNRPNKGSSQRLLLWSYTRNLTENWSCYEIETGFQAYLLICTWILISITYLYDTTSTRQILKDWLTCHTKNLGPIHLINENKLRGGKNSPIHASKTEVFTWRTAKAYFIPSRPPCLTSHCSCVSNLSSTSTVLWTPVSFMCFNTTPNVWAQVSRTGATTYKWESKITHICKKTYFVRIWNLIG